MELKIQRINVHPRLRRLPTVDQTQVECGPVVLQDPNHQFGSAGC